MPLPDGDRYLPVKPERFETLMRVMGELYQGDGRDGERLQFPAVRAPCLGELDEALGSVEQPFKLQTDERTETRVRALSAPSEPLPEGHGGLRANLRPYQLDGLRWLQHLRAQALSGVLADDMGLGKTLQTIAHLCVEVKSGRAHRPSMIVAPTSLVGNWKRELAKFADDLRRVQALVRDLVEYLLVDVPRHVGAVVHDKLDRE